MLGQPRSGHAARVAGDLLGRTGREDVAAVRAAADHLIDMGPGGGPDGGRILAAGLPEHVARAPGSATGPWLAEHLGWSEARQPGSRPAP